MMREREGVQTKREVKSVVHRRKAPTPASLLYRKLRDATYTQKSCLCIALPPGRGPSLASLFSERGFASRTAVYLYPLCVRTHAYFPFARRGEKKLQRSGGMRQDITHFLALSLSVFASPQEGQVEEKDGFFGHCETAHAGLISGRYITEGEITFRNCLQCNGVKGTFNSQQALILGSIQKN